MQILGGIYMKVKKSKYLVMLLVITMSIAMLFCNGLHVNAESSKDGLSVIISSDKENYNLEDEVKLKITVKNTNDFEVSDIKVENILPDGISLVSGDISKDSINLQANEEATMNLTVKKANSRQAEPAENVNTNAISTGKSDSPKTGEKNTTLIAFIVLLISTVIMIICFWKGKKHLKFLSLFLCLGFVGTFGITGITYAVSDNTQTKTINSSEENISSFTTEFTYVIDDVGYTHNVITTYYDVDLYIYQAVDKALRETIVTDIFKNANLEKRKEIVSTLLNKLESENKIKKGSIKFNEEYNSYFFKYINGGEGSVMLEDFSSSEENEEGLWNKGKSFDNDNINKTYIESFANGNINNNANGYIKNTLSKSDLTYYPKEALIIDCINDNYERNVNNAYAQIWSSNDLRTDIKSNVTVKEFKTILKGYNFINIDTHGFIDYKGNPTICLYEKQSLFEDDEYCEDIKEKRVGTIYGFFGGNFYLTSDFFSYYYPNALIDKIIWLSCCGGYSKDILVDTFANKCSAKAVIGATDTILAGYDNQMRDFFVHKLLFGYSVDEALKEAKQKYGKDDAEWYRIKYNKKDNTPAECKNYNGGNEKLVELVRINNNGTLSGTITDENGNPIKGAEIGIHNIRGMSYGITATTNENGEYTLECPQDSYKIGVKADGYEVIETDDFVNVVYGEETIYNIILNTEKPETDYQKQYYTFIENELIPKYGLANVDTDILFSKSNGIVSAVIDDFSNTGSMDLLVIRLKSSAESIETICEWYTLKGDTVVPVDEITVKSENGITSNIDISFNQGYLCFTANRIWLNSNNAESSIWIYSFDSSKLTPLRNYKMHRFNGYVNEITETIKNEINIKSQDYDILDLNDVKAFFDDLKSLGIAFNNEKVDCEFVNGSNLLNYALSIRESLFENCKFIITDYTNLRSHFINTNNDN